MATAIQVEDHISCGVCYDICEEPHALRCLHSFCLQCINQLQVSEILSVQCPQCRVMSRRGEIKPDFRLQALIDHRADVGRRCVGAVSSLSSVCDLCGNEDRPVTWHCGYCDQCMCTQCEGVHSKMTATKYHSVQGLGDLLQEYLTTSVETLGREQQGVATQIQQIQQKVEAVNENHKKQVEAAEKYIDDMIDKLNDFRPKLHEMISDATSKRLNDLSSSEEVLKKSRKQLDDKIHFLSDTSTIENIPRLILTAKIIDVTLNTEIEEIHTKQSEIKEQLKQNLFRVEMEETWCPRTHLGITEKPEQALFVGLHEATYRQALSATFEPSLYRACLVDDKLWCSAYGDNVIYVYTQDCQLTKEIRLPQLEEVVSLTNTHMQNIIVACSESNGLHQITKQGAYTSVIQHGSFSDVCSYKHRVYAVEYVASKIVIFVNRASKWVQEREILLKPNIGDDWDRIGVYNSGIYITSCFYQTLFHYNMDGELDLKSKGGHLPPKELGKLVDPLLGKIDRVGNVIILDQRNHRILIKDTDQHWNVLSLPSMIKNPKDIVLDQTNENIWVVEVAALQPCTLTKFTRTDQ